jgi:hypothetical protein
MSMLANTSRQLRAILGFALLLSAVPSLRADTVDAVHDSFGAYDSIIFWGGGYAGDIVGAGVYMLDKTNSTGIGDTWSNGLIPGFCIELHEPAPDVTVTYDVQMPDDVYNSYTGEVLGTTKANYLRELWAKHYDSAWASGGSYTDQQNSMAAIFAAAVWEIIYEKLPATPAGWDGTVDGTPGYGGFRATNLDIETANKWLHELTGSGAKADLLVISHNGMQDYLVAVPEPATLLLLGLGGALGLLGRGRRTTARQRFDIKSEQCIGA